MGRNLNYTTKKKTNKEKNNTLRHKVRNRDKNGNLLYRFPADSPYERLAERSKANLLVELQLVASNPIINSRFSK